MYNKLKLLGGAAIVSIFASPAFAQETPAGTSINNQATVTYSVGGSNQSSTSNTATFVVDKKVNLAVAEVGGTATKVSIGSTDQVTTFTVTNLTNATQDIRLTGDQQTVSIPLLGTDDFNVTNIRVFVDSNGNGTYDAGVDTATYIDELAPDATVTVFIVANIPNTAGIHTAIVGLKGTVAAGGTSGSLGADLVATSLLTPDSPTTVDIVFADDANLLDQLRDGSQWAFDAYTIDSAAVTGTKTARVVSDPYNLLVNPKAIPGATVEYCISVANAGPGIATSVAISDAIPANTTFVSGSIAVGGLGVGQCLLNGTPEDDNNTGADETDLYGGYYDSGTHTVHATLGSVLPLVPLNISFRVTIN
ncbi:DUF11 domain-containing protein [Sphingomonas sp. AOB5]|uniref:DUF11 domain-containing protein n=1 Tax=Sphingomonas sp. AOB5 TaxID=3034017 RepID=UPI0023F6F951|nr:DUF11 domain-containing protein [Sphingomonas sp. AOB5]MDF7777137.1 DUF11 domain-containing protein [Sphingomonas sp. AOB5]